jgi:hypothetical protein
MEGGDWQAKARTTKTGWQVEMAIPFRIFRLPRKPSAFALWFSRTIPSPRLENSTFPYRRGQGVDNTAEWDPLDLPKFKSPILLMPYTSLLVGDNEKGVRTGLDLKQHLPNGLQWQTTVNPDFRNIEDIVETIDFNLCPSSFAGPASLLQRGTGLLPTIFHVPQPLGRRCHNWDETLRESGADERWHHERY